MIYVKLRLSTKKAKNLSKKKNTKRGASCENRAENATSLHQKKTKKQTKKKVMRDLAAKKSAKNRSLTFKKGRRGSLLRRDFFSFVAQKPLEKVPFFGTFLGAFRGADFSRPSTCGRDVTLFPRHDACNNTTTHTHLREREERERNKR